MKSKDDYHGKIQTFVKHFVFERYLNTVAFKVGMFKGSFVFIDAFAGPWKSQGGDYGDTSFKIAIDVLAKAQNAIQKQKWPNFRIRCLFIEKDPAAFSELSRVIQSETRISAEAINGEFESSIPSILKCVGKSFAFIFVDPTSWQGFGLSKMAPLYNGHNELLINFMFDHINRFIEHGDDSIATQMDELMGGEDWRDEFKQIAATCIGREEAIIETYKARLKRKGRYKFVSSFRVLKPTSDRTYFHLVYATNSIVGIEEFSRVEKKAVEEQILARSYEQDVNEIEASMQGGFFEAGEHTRRHEWFHEDRKTAIERGEQRLLALLNTQHSMTYEKIFGALLELPLFWKSDVSDVLLKLRDNGKISMPELKPRQKYPAKDAIIRLVTDN